MKKFFSLVLALVMALSLTSVAFGADVTEVDAADDAAIAAALADTTTAKLVINLPATTGDNFFTIELYTNYNAAIKSVTINGTDKTKVKFANAQVRLVDFDEFTINDCEILKMKDKFWGHLVFGGAKAGGVYTVSDCLFTGVDTQGIYINSDVDGAQFIVEGCTFTGDFGTEGAVGLQNNSKATTLTVTDNDFAVTNGEEIAIHYHKEALTLNSDVDETVLIKASGDATAEENFEKAVATAVAGDTFKLMADVTVTDVVIDKPISINENGNTLTGMTAGSGVTTDANGDITSGTFATAPADADVAAGYAAMEKTDGTYVVVPAVGGDKFDLYKADDSLKAKLALGAEDVAGLSFTEYNAKTNANGTGNLAYIAAHNGEYFVKTIHPTVADFAVTASGKTDVLYYVTAVDFADVQFVATAKAFNNFGTKCGQLYQVDKEVVYFEIIVGATAGVLPGDVVVEVYPNAQGAYACTPMNVLVGNEIKVVDSAELVAGTTLTPDKLLKHSWAVTGVNYSASLGNVPTEAKCLNCGAVVDKFYLGAGKVPAGETGLQLAAPYAKWYIVEPDFVSYPSGGTVVTPSTDKTVTSAQTFDAGIAMYVGMSVMAAAGSVVVFKKRED